MSGLLKRQFVRQPLHGLDGLISERVSPEVLHHGGRVSE
jgi:hypothetical protein